MRRLASVDRLLLATLVPFWLLVVTLHAYHAADSGNARTALLATPSAHPEGYPKLGSLRPDRGIEGTGVQTGDILLRIGAADLRGVGHLEFGAIAAGQAGPDLGYELEFERAGVRRTVALSLEPTAYPWNRLPVLVAAGLLAVFLILRAPQSRQARAFFLGITGLAAIQLPVEGASYTATLTNDVFRFFFGPVAWWLVIRWVILLPDEVQRRGSGFSPAWAWLAFPLWFSARSSYLFGGPIPSANVPALVLASDSAFLGLLLAILTRNFLHAGPIGRRQLKWVLFGGWIGVGAAAATTLLGSFLPRTGWMDAMIASASLLLLAVPLGFLIGILRYNLFDIDRLLSATATYSFLLALFLAGLFAVVPTASSAASAALGAEPSSVQLAFSVALAASLVPLNRVVRPRVERVLFPERDAIARGIAELLREIAECERSEETLPLLGERLAVLIRPESCVVYVRSEDRFAVAFVHGQATPPAVGVGTSLAVAVAEQSAPFSAGEPRGRRRHEVLDPFARAALESLSTEVVVPIASGNELMAFVTLGPKLSGDIYTSHDLTLLAAVGETAALALKHLEGTALQEALRRYVPHAVAEQLSSGREVEAREREVSVLFVDIRGYAAYSEGRGAQEIFSAISRYTELVSGIVREYAGSTVEFNGDGMMAVFGAPEELPHKERAAMLAGLAIVDRIERRRLSPGETSAEQIRVGVGIATGIDFVGNIQAADRWVWSAIGNATTLASRLQSLTRDLDASLIVDRRTHESAGSTGRRDFQLRRAQPIRGRTQPEDLYVLPLSS